MERLKWSVIVGIGIIGMITFGIGKTREATTHIPTATAQAVKVTKPCGDQPAEAYLIKAEHILNARGERDGLHVDIATTASAWMQMYLICSQLQKESVH